MVEQPISNTNPTSLHLWREASGAADASVIRPVSEVEVELFRAQGWVLLRQILAPGFVEWLRGLVDSLMGSPELADLSQMRVGRSEPESAASASVQRSDSGRFLAGTDYWLTHDEFAEAARDPGLAGIAARLMGSVSAGVYEDSVLVKEPGSKDLTRWHQDVSYFSLVGDDICTMWIPLQPVVPASGGLRFARGSHRDFPLYRPTLFVTDESLPRTDGEEIADLDLRQCTIDEPAYELGDISVHHGQTLHSAGPNLGVSNRGAYSIRYFGPRARFRRKPGLIAKDWQAELVDGDELPANLGLRQR